jgi:hypothetical protein
MITEATVRVWNLTHFPPLGCGDEFAESCSFIIGRKQGVHITTQFDTIWTMILRIASGSCSPVPPDKVYDRSNPFGPWILMSQFSVARDPVIETRHSPAFSVSPCSMLATISLHS